MRSPTAAIKRAFTGMIGGARSTGARLRQQAEKRAARAVLVVGLMIVSGLGALWLMSWRSKNNIEQQINSADSAAQLKGFLDLYSNADRYSNEKLIGVLLDEREKGCSSTAAAIALKQKLQQEGSILSFPPDKKEPKLMHIEEAMKTNIFQLLEERHRAIFRMKAAWLLLTPVLRGCDDHNAFDVYGAFLDGDFVALSTDKHNRHELLQAATLVHELNHLQNKDKGYRLREFEKLAREDQAEFLERRLKELEEKDRKIVEAELKRIRASLETANYLNNVAFGRIFEDVYPAPMILARHLLSAGISSDRLSSLASFSTHDARRDRQLRYAIKIALIVLSSSHDAAISQLKALSESPNKFEKMNARSALAYLKGSAVASREDSGAIMPDEIVRFFGELEEQLFARLPEKSKREAVAGKIGVLLKGKPDEAAAAGDYLASCAGEFAAPQLLQALNARFSDRQALERLVKPLRKIVAAARTEDGYGPVLKLGKKLSRKNKNFPILFEALYFLSFPREQLEKSLNGYITELELARSGEEAQKDAYHLSVLTEAELAGASRDRLFEAALRALQKWENDPLVAEPCLEILNSLWGGRSESEQVYVAAKAALQATKNERVARSAAILAMKSSPLSLDSVEEVMGIIDSKAYSDAASDQIFLLGMNALLARSFNEDLREELFEGGPGQRLKQKIGSAGAIDLWLKLADVENALDYLNGLELSEDPLEMEVVLRANLKFMKRQSDLAREIKAENAEDIEEFKKRALDTSLKALETAAGKIRENERYNSVAGLAMQCLEAGAPKDHEGRYYSIFLNSGFDTDVRTNAALSYMESAVFPIAVRSFISSELPKQIRLNDGLLARDDIARAEVVVRAAAARRLRTG
ncbi:MAG: hypothetical protein ABIB65_00395, partial [Candidatus Margulisiibacteriota bacterium]